MITSGIARAYSCSRLPISNDRDSRGPAKEGEAMANYVDGFVVPVPKRNVAQYRKMAKLAGKIWREHGALDYVESMADDVKPGKITSFPQAVKLKSNESVWFSFIVYKSRRHRDAVNKKIMADPRIAAMGTESKAIFDCKRMAYGGFSYTKDTTGVNGPMEQALIGTPIIDPTKPIEVLRVIHSFDPCLSCAVHVMRPEEVKPVVIVNAGVTP